jgi:hypothetical protein
MDHGVIRKLEERRKGDAGIDDLLGIPMDSFLASPARSKVGGDVVLAQPIWGRLSVLHTPTGLTYSGHKPSDLVCSCEA